MIKALLYLRILKTSLLLLIPVVILIFPLDTFFTGPAVCDPNSADYNSCGIWQAIYSFFHLDFESVKMFNSRAFFIAPLFLFVWVLEMRDDYAYYQKFKV